MLPSYFARLRLVHRKWTCWSKIIQHCFMQYVGLVWTLYWIMSTWALTCLKLSSNMEQHCWPNDVARCWLRFNRLIYTCLRPKKGLEFKGCFPVTRLSYARVRTEKLKSFYTLHRFYLSQQIQIELCIEK